jgi:transaldolase
MSANPLQRLTELGQSVWYDFIRRDLMVSGELARLIADDALRGMTSNPTIFAKAIATGTLYDDDIRRASQIPNADTATVFEAIAVEDVRRAADVFRPIYESSGGGDGLVSIEVRPSLAYDTQGTIEEVRRLWRACDRPNVMVKIPGTAPGLPAIEQCLAEGINVNITLLFSVARYREVMDAWLAALEQRHARSEALDRVASVASFFVSRVDTSVDRQLAARLQAAPSGPDSALLTRLRAQLAIANARVAYEAFEAMRASTRWQRLAAAGARVQRPLWASTSTKDPTLSDVYYVEALIAPDTVNTLPPETFAAYRDHGAPAVRIHDDRLATHQAMRDLATVGIDLDAVTHELEVDGVKKFADSYDELLKTIAAKRAALRAA